MRIQFSEAPEGLSEHCPEQTPVEVLQSGTLPVFMLCIICALLPQSEIRSNKVLNKTDLEFDEKTIFKGF
jgi:hypothetical protein